MGEPRLFPQAGVGEMTEMQPERDDGRAAVETEPEERGDPGGVDEGFWGTANEYGRRSDTARYKLRINRLAPFEYDGEPIENTENLMELDLPTDRESVEVRVKQRFGGGTYECIIRDGRTGVAIERTSGGEHLKIDGAPNVPTRKKTPQQKEIAENEEEMRAIASRLKLAQTQKQMAEFTNMSEKAGSDPMTALLLKMVIERSEVREDPKVAVLAAEMAGLKDTLRDALARKAEPAADNGIMQLMIQMMQAQAQTQTTLLTEMIKKPPQAGPGLDQMLDFYDRMAERAGGGGDEGGDSLGLKDLIPAILPLLTQTSRPNPQQLTPEQQQHVKALTQRIIQERAGQVGTRQLSAAPAAPAPAAGGQEAENPMATNPIAEAAGLMVQELAAIEAAPPNQWPLPAAWAKRLWQSADMQSLAQIIAASDLDLAMLLMRAAPAQFGQLRQFFNARPVPVRKWIAANLQILKHWYNKRAAAAAAVQPAPSASPAAPADDAEEGEENGEQA